MSSSIKEKTIKGGLWNGIEQFGKQVVQFLIGVAMARLLSPNDFGMYAIVILVVNFSNVLINSGFMQALIQKEKVTQKHYSTVFWFSVLVSVIIYLIFFFLAPLLAVFFNHPTLVKYFRVVSLVIFFVPINVVTTTILNRKFDFKSPAIIILTASTASGIAGILMALNGFGIWALITQNIVLQASMTTGFWIAAKWRPELLFSQKAFSSLFSYGSKILISDVIDFSFRNSYTVVIGKFFSTRELGYYNRANSFPNVINNIFTSVLGKVSFVSLSALQNDIKKLKSSFIRTIKLQAFLLLPVMMIFALISDSFIEIVLTKKWMPIVPYIKILCISLSFYALMKVNSILLKALGKSNVYLKLEIYTKVILIVTLFFTYKYTLQIVLWGNVLSYAIAFGIYAYETSKQIKYKLFSQLSDVAIPLMTTLFSAAAILFFQSIISNKLIDMFISPIVGILTYFLLSHIFQKEQIIEVKNIIYTIIQRK